MNKSVYLTAASLLVLSANAQAQDTSLVFAYWGDPAELPPFQEIVAEYEAANPEVTIEVQHAPWSGYFTRLDAQLAAGAGPDVFFITNVPNYAARNQLEPLDQWIADSGFPIDQYNQEALVIHSLNDQLYSIPRDNDTNALYYNVAAFDEAGLDYPDETWTWTELREAANELTQRQGNRVMRYGFATEANDWPNWINQNGGSVFDDPRNPTDFLMDEPQAVEAIQFLGDMINQDRIMPSFQELQQSGGTGQLFLSGQTAMVVSNAARLGTFANADFEWAVAPLPAGPDGQRANRLGGAGFAMNAFSQNKDAAWKARSSLHRPTPRRCPP
jgi:multiple sugar transport system substrate-binding protein